MIDFNDVPNDSNKEFDLIPEVLLQGQFNDEKRLKL